MCTANKTPGQWRAHGRYIARESAGGATQVQVIRNGMSGEMAPVEPAAELERWQSESDLRLWKLIVLPEFEERLDLDRPRAISWIALRGSGTTNPVAICPVITFGTISGRSRKTCAPGRWDIATTWMPPDLLHAGDG
jgi:hypothetical protein